MCNVCDVTMNVIKLERVFTMTNTSQISLSNTDKCLYTFWKM